MASRNKTDGLARLLGKEVLSKGVKVYMEEDVITIDLHIIVEYEYRICENMVSNVKYSVEFATASR